MIDNTSSTLVPKVTVWASPVQSCRKSTVSPGMHLNVVREIPDELGGELVVVVVDPHRDGLARTGTARSGKQHQHEAAHPNGPPERSKSAPHEQSSLGFKGSLRSSPRDHYEVVTAVAAW